MISEAKAQSAPVLFVSAGGATLRLDFAVESVVSLRHETTAALRVVRTVRQDDLATPIAAADLRRMADNDLMKIDLETFIFATQYLTGSDPRTILIVPASFTSLATRRGRRALAETLGELLKTQVMTEFLDVDRGTPVSRLTEVGTLIASVCRGVLVRLTPGRDPAAPVRGYRPHGLSVDAADFGEHDSQIAAQLLGFAELARGAAPTLMVFGLPNHDFFAVAEVGGVTHASSRLQPPVVRSAA
jgi:hypothetical protein